GSSWDQIQQWCEAAGLHAAREPVRDFDPENLAERLPDCARALDALVAAGHKVYLHCTAGVNRSPSVAIAWLVWKRGMSLREAYALVKQRRYCEPGLAAIQVALRRQPVL
ncbi:MAG: dual specificity protein phosphatase family protein, partial [Bryobacteraceae bacterium]